MAVGRAGRRFLRYRQTEVELLELFVSGAAAGHVGSRGIALRRDGGFGAGLRGLRSCGNSQQISGYQRQRGKAESKETPFCIHCFFDSQEDFSANPIPGKWMAGCYSRRKARVNSVRRQKGRDSHALLPLDNLITDCLTAFRPARGGYLALSVVGPVWLPKNLFQCSWSDGEHSIS